jgi:hypothetical protein
MTLDDALLVLIAGGMALSAFGLLYRLYLRTKEK